VRWETRRFGLNLTVAGFGLAGTLLILTQPWQAGLMPLPPEAIAQQHGRQAAGGALINGFFYIGPMGAGLLLLGAAGLAYKAARA
jgi:hypothetical protein